VTARSTSCRAPNKPTFGTSVVLSDLTLTLTRLRARSGRQHNMACAYRPYQHVRQFGLAWSTRDELSVVGDHIDRDAEKCAAPLPQGKGAYPRAQLWQDPYRGGAAEAGGAVASPHVPAPRTTPSVASLLSGLTPPRRPACAAAGLRRWRALTRCRSRTLPGTTGCGAPPLSSCVPTTLPYAIESEGEREAEQCAEERA
jgi:hypothetical protein